MLHCRNLRHFIGTCGVEANVNFVISANSWLGEDWPQIKYVGWPKTERKYRTGFSLTNQRPAASLEDYQSLLPLPTIAMTKKHNIIAVLARVAKSQQEIKMLVNSAYGNKTLSINLINWIIKSVNAKKTAKMSKWTNYIMVAVATAI